MTNMSYCQFQNTRGDLRQCMQTLSDILEETDLDPSECETERLSGEEARAALDIIGMVEAMQREGLTDDEDLIAKLNDWKDGRGPDARRAYVANDVFGGSDR